MGDSDSSEEVTLLDAVWLLKRDFLVVPKRCWIDRTANCGGWTAVLAIWEYCLYLSALRRFLIRNIVTSKITDSKPRPTVSATGKTGTVENEIENFIGI